MNPRAAWRQAGIPVIYKPDHGPLMVRLPFRAGNGEWVQDGRQYRQRWNREFRCWETPQNWFSPLLRKALQSFGKVFVIQEYRPQEKCAPACWNAEGFDCVCSCLGKNHGSGQPLGRWFIVSDTCAIHSGGKELSCRLLERKKTTS
jgi:hypothetical protein